jgi:hypothetical protein
LLNGTLFAIYWSIQILRNDFILTMIALLKRIIIFEFNNNPGLAASFNLFESQFLIDLIVEIFNPNFLAIYFDLSLLSNLLIILSFVYKLTMLFFL